MKNFVQICLILFAINISWAFAADLSAGVQKSGIFDYLESVNLTPAQRQKILNIRKEEMQVLEPFMLDVQSKERGLEFLNSLECKRFDSVCKTRLKEDIEQREFELREAERKVLQKKNYYRIRYRNVLTREQDLKIKKMIEETEHKEKVLMERAERAKKQERIDKLKIWRKIPDVKSKLFKKRN